MPRVARESAFRSAFGTRLPGPFETRPDRMSPQTTQSALWIRESQITIGPMARSRDGPNPRSPFPLLLRESLAVVGFELGFDPHRQLGALHF